jgi:2-dehydropantoate 2-reductase
LKCAVAGAGGIGATIAARLAAAGHEVVLLARGAHLAALQAQGLRFVDEAPGGADASGTWRLPAAADGAGFGPQDAVFLAVKAHQIEPALPGLQPLLGPQTLVVPAINGLPWWYFHGAGSPHEGRNLRCLDPAGRIAAALPATRIAGCVVHMAGELRAPGLVHCTAGRRLILGEAERTRAAASASLEQLAAALRDAGFAIEVSADIRHDIWVKLVGNLSFNPVAALTGYRMDQICGDEEVLQVIRAILLEGGAVAAALGVDIGMTPDQRIDIARQLGGARISMLQDLEAGRSLEIAPIVGAVLELAGLLGIPVPATRGVHALLQARVRALGLPGAGPA